MPGAPLSQLYRDYIACLNAREWSLLARFVADDVVHNGRPLGLAGYRRLLEDDRARIPDLHYDIELLVTEAPLVAARLRFDCTPSGELLGLPVNGRRVRFAENVLYRYSQDRIAQVWSVIDKAALEAQLSGARAVPRDA
jgi:predicted ester cyclase